MLKTLLYDSWIFYINNFRSILVIILPIVIPTEILIGIYSYYFVTEEYLFSEQIFPLTINLITYPVYTLGVILFIASKTAGIKMDLKALFELGLKFWKPYLIIYVLLYLALIAGLILLIVPGIIISVRLIFSEFHLIFDKLKPIDAMKLSWNSTKGYRWTIFWGYFLIGLVVSIPLIFLSDFLHQINIYSLTLNALCNVSVSIFGVLYTVFAFHVYKFSKEKNNETIDFKIS